MSKRIAILGAQESGTGAALLAQARGYAVFVSELNTIAEAYRATLTQAGIEFEEGGHTEARILGADEIVKSPGIPDSVPLLRKAVAAGIPVISEIELAARYCEAPIILISGTNGKSTTAKLTWHLLTHAGINAGLAGNIGNSFAMSVLQDAPVRDVYVVEVSSFQLDGMYQAKADTAILLNITADHLDRYGNQIENYVRSKFRIVQNMRPNDAFIYFCEDRLINHHLAENPVAVTEVPVSLMHEQKVGGYLSGNELVFKPVNGQKQTVALEQIALAGKHNMLNVLAAVLAAHRHGAKMKAIKEALGTYETLPHRMEPVAAIKGVGFINDSKATNVDSVFYALDSFDQPIIWVVGGIDKGNAYNEIEPLVRNKVKAIVCLGKDNNRLLAAFTKTGLPITETTDVHQAVAQAYEQAQPGHVVLFSPACSSFDLFKNFQDRGDQFKQAVLALKGEVEHTTEQT